MQHSKRTFSPQQIFFSILFLSLFTGIVSCTQESIPEVDGNAEPLTVKVAVVIQDPVVPGTGKRLHEYFKTPGYSFEWHDPWELTQAYADTMHAVSNGVIRYEIVEIYDDSLFFSRFKDSEELFSLNDVVHYLGEPEWKTLKEKGTTFDYNAFIQHYGFGEMRDKDEIHEVWVWTFPYGGMWESTYSGKDAFWLNSTPVQNPSNEKLLTVMGLNYEREMSLAMESYGHRFESVMRHVYGRWDYDVPYEEKNNWELYTTYDKVSPGNAHIGNIHYPPNGQQDYDFYNNLEVSSAVDTWANYPDLENESRRIVSCSEWDCSHLGYMCFWYRNVPHFAGINPDDGHLNNWWHYVVNYEEAMQKESELK